MPERRLAAYAEAVQLLRRYADHSPRCPALPCECGWNRALQRIVELQRIADGHDECIDCGGSGWCVPAPDELRRCGCNPERGAPVYVAGDDAQPARLSSGGGGL